MSKLLRKATGIAITMAWAGAAAIAAAGLVPVATHEPQPDFAAHVPTEDTTLPEDLFARMSDLRHTSHSFVTDVHAQWQSYADPPAVDHVMIPLPAGVWTGLAGLAASAAAVAWTTRPAARRAAVPATRIPWPRG